MAYNKETGMWEGFIYKIWNDVNDKLYIGQTYSTIKERWHGHKTACISNYKGKSVLYNAMKYYGRDKFHIEEIAKITTETKDELIKQLNELEKQYISKYHTCIYDPLCNGYNTEAGGDNKHVSGRHVIKYDKDLNPIQEYDSIMSAAKDNNIDNATIWAVCHHYYYTAAGFVWAYKGDDPIAPDYETGIKNRYEKSRIYWEKWKKEHPKKERIKKPYVSKAMPKEIKKQRKLDRSSWWDGRRICVYNAFGELLNTYDDFIDACHYIGISTEELRDNVIGKKLKYKRYVLRYEGDDFNKYPMSRQLRAVKIYDLQGWYITRFSCYKEAEDFLKCPSGEIKKVLKRGGSCKGYLIAPYNKPLVRKLNRIDKIYEMLDDNMNVIKEFPNGQSVARFFNAKDVHHQLINAINSNKKYHGYYWRIKEEFKINN